MNIIDDKKQIEKLLKQKALKPFELAMFEKTNTVDKDNHRFVKEHIYNVKDKDFETLQEIVVIRIQNLERTNDEYLIDDCKYAMGNAGELICVFILKKKAA